MPKLTFQVWRQKIRIKHISNTIPASDNSREKTKQDKEQVYYCRQGVRWFRKGLSEVTFERKSAKTLLESPTGGGTHLCLHFHLLP